MILKKITFTTILLFASLHAQKLQHISIQLQWLDQFQFAGYYLAKEKGFYKDVNLDVKIRPYKLNLNIAKEVENHQATLGIGSSSLLLNIANGAKLKLLYATFQSSPLVLIAKKKSNIHSVKDFIGKRIMLINDQASTASFYALFHKFDISEDEIIKQNYTFNINDLINNNTDLMTAYISNEPFLLEKRGVNIKIFDPKNYGFDFYSDILFTSQSEIKNHKQRVIDFIKASLKGWGYAFSHIDESVNIILKKYNSQHKTKDALMYEARQLKKLAYYKTSKIGTIDKDKIQSILDIYNVLGLLNQNKKINTNNIIFQQYLDNNTLTKQELLYLQNKKIIKVCYDKTFYPISFIYNGEMQGVSNSILNLVSNKIGIKFDYIETKDWKEQLNYLQQGKCDINAVAITKPNYYNFLKPTVPYISDQLVLITKINEPYFSSLKEIKNKTIGLKYGFDTLKKYLQTNYPSLKFIFIKNGKCNEDIVNGKVFGCADISFRASVNIAQHYRNRLKIMANILPNNISGGFGVSDKEPTLLKILDKALKSIDKSKIDHTMKRYYRIKVEQRIDWKAILYIGLISVFLLIVIIIFLLREKKFNHQLKKKIQETICKTKEQEKQLLEQSKLIQAGKIISMIAHQWRQPLMVMSSTCSSILLKAQLNKLDNKKTVQLVTKLSDDIQYLSSTIDDFRSFFKPNEEKEKTTSSKIIKDAIKIILPSLENNHINLIKELNSNELLYTYPDKLKHVILNLIQNAQDVLIEKNILNPTITIKTKDRFISIEDNAKGVPNKFIDKIFDPYFSTKSNKNGTGLGLYISKTIVEEHCKGNLKVTNSSSGAVFVIEL